MDNRESLLVLCSIAFALVSYGVALFKGPSINPIKFLSNPIRFEQDHFPKYCFFIGAVVIISAPIGRVLGGDFQLALKFTAINAIIAALSGLLIFLYRSPER